MALANEFFKAGEKFPLKMALHVDSSEVTSEAPTKLTNPLPSKGSEPLDSADVMEFDQTEVPTKLTKPTSLGVVSVLSVLSGQDEFDDRVVCTACKNFRYGHCAQHIRAEIGNSSKVAINLVSLPQRCPAFAAKDDPSKSHFCPEPLYPRDHPKCQTGVPDSGYTRF